MEDWLSARSRRPASPAGRSSITDLVLMRTRSRSCTRPCPSATTPRPYGNGAPASTAKSSMS